MKIHLPSLLMLFLLSCVSPAALAQPVPDLPQGKRQVMLIDDLGKPLTIGSVSFEGQGQTRQVQVTLDSPLFTDHFLSMRPFRCLEDARQWACHLTYPYKLRHQITATDLTDLEYQLMFIGKKPSEFGINAWNGLYYKLALQAQGVMVGTLHEADFNVLAVPPEGDEMRPITPAQLSPAGSTPRYVRIEIR
jgi:hypothetical protein